MSSKEAAAAAPTSKGAARRRRQKQNALDKCPGYEPNPAFQYLERCKHCGFSKAEHKVIKSSGEGVLYSYLDSEGEKKADAPKRDQAEAPLFSYLDVQVRTQGSKPKTNQPGVASFVPQGPSQDVSAAFPKRHVSANKQGSAVDHHDEHEETLDAHGPTQAAAAAAAARTSLHDAKQPAQQVSHREKADKDDDDDDHHHDQEEDEEDDQGDVPTIHENGPMAGAPSATLASDAAETGSLMDSMSHMSQSFDPAATLRTVSGLFSRILPQSEPDVTKRVEEDAEEEEDDVDEDADFESPSVAPARKPLFSLRSESSNRPSQPAVKKSSITSLASSSAKADPSTRRSTRVSGMQRVSRFFALGKQRPVSRLAASSPARAPLDVTSARDAHLEQIQRLLKVTNAGAKRTRAKFRVYEEPSKETLDLYRSDTGKLVWSKAMDIGWTKLHVAAWNRDDKRVAREARASFDAIDTPTTNTGETALSLAVKRGSQHSVFALVEAGAAVDQADHFGFSPMHYAVRNNDHEVVNMLAAGKANLNAVSDELRVSVLHMACRYADTDLVSELLDRQLNVNARDARGWTPLFYAVMRPGRSDLVDLLIANKADVRAKSGEGLTTLHCATLSDDPEHVTALVERGVRMDLADESGFTAMHYCARFDAGASLRRLLEYGARLKPKSEAPFTPYEIALHYDNDSVVETIESWRDFRTPETILDSPEIERETPLGVHMHVDEELDLAELAILEGIFSNGSGNGADGGECCSIS
ncbi:Ankyrin repeat and protein kinase domain-containing protein 1 [Hondaea fermentalgiana]|uniref:Ankyrin repeat and protein kinase domain-containing protein 1 n=1 Tax=Hondaea fermentalgiana TaxID=2315210 RepID=A0A2R5G3F5_9STRA|nr:Ankyrin repeat and protein kinase domain-containing protein 1 [Hondaea fermentalgiana]|eukprot:GBG24278.1 Ankyrin repeat and protein kinase domain-containing protein 1 [Hondaea fermentalgiana]